MAYGPDWFAVRGRVETRPWAAAVAAALREGFEAWRGLPIPGPERESAWTHHYFCDADGSALRFDPAGPDRHACTECGEVYAGEPWDGAWRTMTHNAVAAQAQRAALLLHLTPPPETRHQPEAAAVEGGRARAELERILGTYARDYLAYQPHGKAAGTGRVQPQSLDEAVWAIGLLRAARWSDGALSQETDRQVDRMAEAIIDLLRPQVGAVHNIHCWLLAALAECAARLGDTGLLTWCRDSDYGAEAQIRQGFHPEGLWYEINPHYHYYALTALLSYVEATGPGGLSEESAARLARAVAAPPLLAYADGRFPAYGDGWADCFVSGFAPLAEAAWTLLPAARPDVAPYHRPAGPSPLSLWYGASVPETTDPLPHRASVAALVFGPDDIQETPEPADDSFVWPGPGIALLRSPGVRLTVRSGPDAGWHDHRDKLAVDVRTATGWSSLDLGTSGYGAAFTSWMRSPVAHNTVTVGARPQPPHTGRIVGFSPRRVTAESAWDGHVLRRTITVHDHGWTDVLTLTLAGPDEIEWAFHGDGTFTTPSPAVPAVLDDADLGHTWLRDVRRLTVPGGLLQGTWHGVAGAPGLTLTFPEGFTAYAAAAPGNPNGRPLGVLVVRGHAAEASFHAEFTG
ncbi:heparinase II/III family protein [Nonomuraea antimicrobica]|uniref:Heparinase II/III family protein n=1 Tax=Nonomuraea antimicrobica TaxID=561173 RepID=A0ABP7E1C2_9ACTN